MPVDEVIQKVTASAQKILYDPQTSDQMLGQIKGTDPTDSLPRMAVSIVQKIDQKLNNSIPDEAVLPSAIAVLTDLVDFYQQATKRDLSSQQLRKIMNLTVKNLAQAYGTTPEMAKEFMNNMTPDMLETASMGGGYGKAH